MESQALPELQFLLELVNRAAGGTDLAVLQHNHILAIDRAADAQFRRPPRVPLQWRANVTGGAAPSFPQSL
jgi:hypothetical protein